MNPVVEPIKNTIDLNTRLFSNVLEGITDEMATRRPNDGANHVSFIACHMVDARHYLARSLGLAGGRNLAAVGT